MINLSAPAGVSKSKCWPFGRVCLAFDSGSKRWVALLVSSTSVSSSTDWGWQHGFFDWPIQVSKWLQGISGFHATPSLSESIKHATWYQHTSTQTRMITGAASSGDDCTPTRTHKTLATNTQLSIETFICTFFHRLFTASGSNTWFTAACL